MQVYKVNNLSKQYRMGVMNQTALSGIDLDVSPGEFLALAGPSGSGKTTLLNILGCLDAPSSGEVHLNGMRLNGLKKGCLAEIRRRRLGFIFQSFNLFPVLTAYENVEYPLILNRVNADERRKRVLRILVEVGLESKSENFPNQLSGGQQQRVAIARALVHEPDVVLADEPTANLDSRTGRDILDLMEQLNRERGTTFIFATHDPKVMERASRLVKLRDGQIEA